jgi:hypothetical protein
MKKIAIVMMAAMITAFSCATPDTPKTNNSDTVHIAPADTLKFGRIVLGISVFGPQIRRLQR